MTCSFAHSSMGYVEIAKDVKRNRPNQTQSNNFLKGVYEEKVVKMIFQLKYWDFKMGKTSFHIFLHLFCQVKSPASKLGSTLSIKQIVT